MWSTPGVGRNAAISLRVGTGRDVTESARHVSSSTVPQNSQDGGGGAGVFVFVFVFVEEPVELLPLESRPPGPFWVPVRTAESPVREPDTLHRPAVIWA
jgi:hypothetical protein